MDKNVQKYSKGSFQDVHHSSHRFSPSGAGKTFLKANWREAIKKETGLKLLPFPFLRDVLDRATRLLLKHGGTFFSRFLRQDIEINLQLDFYFLIFLTGR